MAALVMAQGKAPISAELSLYCSDPGQLHYLLEEAWGTMSVNSVAVSKAAADDLQMSLGTC